MKKIKQTVKQFFTKKTPVAPVKEKNYLDPNIEPKDYLLVCDINDVTDKCPLHDILGINLERAELLELAVEKSYRKSAINGESIVHAANRVSVDCKHANELFLISVYLMRLHHQSNPISMLLNSLGSR